MRVFLDTNVLVSAFTTRGVCADLVRLILAEHELATGPFVLAELQRVLVQRMRVPAPVASEIVAFLRSQARIAEPGPPPKVRIRDPDDLNVLAEALAVRADILVTGDRDLLVLETIPALAITDPRGFWERLRSGSQR